MSKNLQIPWRVKPLRFGAIRCVESRLLRPNMGRRLRRIGLEAVTRELEDEGRSGDDLCSPIKWQERHQFHELESAAIDASPDPAQFDYAAFERDFDPPLEDWETDKDLHLLEWAVIGEANGKLYGFHSWYNMNIDKRADPWRLRVMHVPCFYGLDVFQAEGRRGAMMATLAILMRHFMLHPFAFTVEGREQRAVVVEWRTSTENPLHHFPASLPHLADVLDPFADIVYAGTGRRRHFSTIRTKTAVLRSVVDGTFTDARVPPPTSAPEPEDEPDIERETIKEMRTPSRDRTLEAMPAASRGR